MSSTTLSNDLAIKSVKRTLPLVLLLAMVIPFYLPLPVLALEQQDYDLQDFTEVSASANIAMNVTVGEGFSVSAKGSAKALERLNLTVTGSRLKAGWKRKEGWGWKNYNGKATIFVTMPTLTYAGASSNSSVKATGIAADSFTAKASSNAKVTVTGTCKNLEGRASSNAVVNAKALQCETVTARASSNGDVAVFATQSVDGRASSNGDVFVYGDPLDIDKETSSNGRVAKK